ncbi:MAG: putative PEP-binding protein, partial [Pygmaiobacter sp.]
SDLASVDKALILGIAVSGGSVQSHCSIIARTYGIPTVVMAGTVLLDTPVGALCALDATDGSVFLDPDDATIARFSHRISISRRKNLTEEKLLRAPCISKNGVPFSLLANCGAPQDIAAAIAKGADGVGLLRSEFLFMGEHLPDEEEQFRFYRDCLLAANGHPVTIRTLDIGADKSVAGVTSTNEENPALGLRGLRLTLARPALLRTQLSALLRAGVYGDLRIMFPMITFPSDLDKAFALAGEVKSRLTANGLEFAPCVPLGCMIETPSAALLAAELAERAAFFSIGTNDLTQYTLAADRLNPAVAPYFDCAAPALQKLIAMTVFAANAADIPVSVCGEAAADPRTALLYASLGVRKFSMAAIALSDVKQALSDAVLLP